MDINNYSLESLKKIIKESFSYSEVAKKIGFKSGKSERLRQIILLADIDVSHFGKRDKKSIIWTVDKLELENIIKTSYTYSDVLRCFGYQRFSGYSLDALRARIKQDKIDISHFTQAYKQNKKLTNEQIFIENSTYYRTHLKKRIIKYGLIPYVCEKCGNTGEWNGKKLVLDIDHKNGINNDNRLENLRFLCPNCHSQEGTSCGKNIKKGLKVAKKKKILKKPKQKDKKEKTKTYCLNCGNETSGRNKTGLCERCAQIAQRKVERPSYEQLLQDKETMSMLAIGKKYKVSDNAVRKWIKQYEKELNIA